MRAVEVQAEVARLRGQLVALEGAGDLRKSYVVRLIHELDEVDRSYTQLKQRELTAPTLQDVVLLPHPMYARMRGPVRRELRIQP
jgi:hypothetical protein